MTEAELKAYTVDIPADLQKLHNKSAVTVRRGWRYFHCGECEHRWKWPSRDALSPSGEDCPRCKVWVHPYNGEIDPAIPCDDSGNLTVPWNWSGEKEAPQTS